MSAEAQALFKSLLKRLRPLFKENGFRAYGQNFIFESAECWVIINFQKSRWNDSNNVTFYINVAACTKRWSGIESKPIEKVPLYYACDWRWRVEHFGPDENIKGWTVQDETTYEETVSYLLSLFNKFVLPATKTMTTEAQLLEHSAGFEYPQLKTRTVILAATNQIEALKQAVSLLIEKFGAGVVAKGTQDHLKLLRSMYPEAMQAIEL